MARSYLLARVVSVWTWLKKVLLWPYEILMAYFGGRGGGRIKKLVSPFSLSLSLPPLLYVLNESREKRGTG